jgi:hypothetical protein
MSNTSSSNPVRIELVPLGVSGDVKGVYQPINFGLQGDAAYGPSGSSGWQIVDRPKSVAATQWFDRSPYQLTMSGILDSGPNVTNAIGRNAENNPGSDSIEGLCMRFESWLDKVTGTNEPPVLSISGPIPGIQRLWVISSLTFDAAIRDRSAGYRVQQSFALGLYEYIPPLNNKLNAYAASPAASFSTLSAINDSMGAQQYYLHAVTASEAVGGLALLSANSYGATTSYVTAIKSLNNIRDDSSLQAGMIIKMPRSSGSVYATST